MMLRKLEGNEKEGRWRAIAFDERSLNYSHIPNNRAPELPITEKTLISRKPTNLSPRGHGYQRFLSESKATHTKQQPNLQDCKPTRRTFHHIDQQFRTASPSTQNDVSPTSFKNQQPSHSCKNQTNLQDRQRSQILKTFKISFLKIWGREGLGLGSRHILSLCLLIWNVY